MNDNKTVLVTGATGGLGLSIAEQFYEQGLNMILTGTNEFKLKSLKEKFSINTKVIKCNLAYAEEITKLFDQIPEEFGNVDILINNAGITKDNLFLRMKDDDWDNVINVNLKANFTLCKSVVKSMVKRRWGRVINISSAVAKMGNAGQTNYAASKAAVEGFTRSLALEVASRGITVNAIAPGFIKTEILETIDPIKLQEMAKNIPIGRIGEAIDIAKLVLFLASDESSYITGQVLHVNGGLTL
ncbi:3-oxoacyl-[acyl-carrier-protein] reductase [Pelagibacteraceae bacterium]|nr:3-oxoacyl-[acyl-carrier-protein] reductase [Pelagibacteraceae bacterium]